MDLVSWSSPKCGQEKPDSFVDIICSRPLTQSRKVRPCRRLNTLQKRAGPGLQKYEEKCRARSFSGARCMPSLPGQVRLQEPRLCKTRWKSCVLFTIQSRKTQFFHPIFTQPVEETFRGSLYYPASGVRHYSPRTPTDRETDRAINLEIEGALIKQIQREGRLVVLGVLGQTGYLSQRGSFVVEVRPQYFK